MKTRASVIIAVVGMLVFHYSCTQPTQPLETTQNTINVEQGSASLGAISGIVFRDLNHNETQDDGEPGLGNLFVHLSSGGGGGWAKRTGSMGEYVFSDLDAGVYTVLLEVPVDAEATTENPLVITLNEEGDGDVEVYDKAHFGIVYRVDPLIIKYDFEDGCIPNWGGNADMAIVNGALELISTHPTEWRWRWKIFDYQLPARYWRGSFEFKAKFGEQGHFFNLKGHSESDIFDHNFGPFVYFKGNDIRPKEGDVSVITGFTYIPGNWYRVRIKFDNGQGRKGRYVLYYQDLTNLGPELKVGEFDYFASSGRLADICEFGFGVHTFGEVSSASFFIDDVILEVRPASGAEKLAIRSSH